MHPSRLLEILALQGILSEHSLELANTLLESFDLGRTLDPLIDSDSFLPALGSAPSPVKRRGRRDAVLPSHVGNRDREPRGFLQDPQLLVNEMPSSALDTRINLNSFCIRRYSRITRLKPSSDLRQYRPVKIGAAPRFGLALIIDRNICRCLNLLYDIQTLS